MGVTTHSSRLLNQTLTWKLSLVNQFLTGTKTKFLTKLFTYLNLDIHYVLHMEGQMDPFFSHFVFHGLSPLLSSVYFFKQKIKNRTLWLLRSTHSNSIPVAKQQGPCTSTMNGFWAAVLYKQPSRAVFITTGVNTLGHTRGKKKRTLISNLSGTQLFSKMFLKFSLMKS